jgi:hypothetical protein
MIIFPCHPQCQAQRIITDILSGYTQLTIAREHIIKCLVSSSQAYFVDPCPSSASISVLNCIWQKKSRHHNRLVFIGIHSLIMLSSMANIRIVSDFSHGIISKHIIQYFWFNFRNLKCLLNIVFNQFYVIF